MQSQSNSECAYAYTAFNITNTVSVFFQMTEHLLKSVTDEYVKIIVHESTSFTFYYSKKLKLHYFF